METIDQMIKRCEQATVTKNILALIDTQGWSVDECLARLQIEAREAEELSEWNEWDFYKKKVGRVSTP